MILGVLAAAGNALLRAIWRVGAPWAQEVPMVLCGIVTLIACVMAYRASIDKHIRVEIFLKNMTPKQRNWLEIIGIFTCLLPWMVLLVWGTLGSPMAFVRFAWITQETSENVGGMPMIYLYKACLAAFPIAFISVGLVRAWQSFKEIAK